MRGHYEIALSILVCLLTKYFHMVDDRIKILRCENPVFATKNHQRNTKHQATKTMVGVGVVVVAAIAAINEWSPTKLVGAADPADPTILASASSSW